jgi:hypothetical protein
MASPFLDNLKNAVNTGEFNSEAAKKIMEINKLADAIIPAETKEELNIRLEAAGMKVLKEEDIELNSQYEKEMEKVKKQDAINAQIVTLIEIEDLVKLSVEDMFSHIQELENKFVNELGSDPLYKGLSEKIEEMKSKYSTIINN